MQNNSRQNRSYIIQLLSSMIFNGRKLTPKKRKQLYLAIILFLLLLLWLPALLVITISKPTYTSEWTLILPGTGTGHAVSLETIGQASATVSSPYSGTSLDPKVNYKAIAESEPVLASAAKKINIPFEQFKKPKIKLVDQSTLMYFSVKAESPKRAKDMSLALYQSLQEQLDWLREDESLSREKAIQAMLSGFGEKLTDAQKNTLDYQTESNIVSIDQFKELTLTIERMRSQKASLNAKLSGLQKQLNSLADTLGIDPTLAADALALQQDQVFQRHLQSFADSSSQLSEYKAKWGDNHPRVINLYEQNRKSRIALLQHSKNLLRKNLSVKQLLTLSINDNRSGLYQDLVTLYTKVTGMESEYQMLTLEMQSLQNRLEENTDEAAALEDLQRKQQVATAVFTTALAKLDIGKSDAFSSYPLLQMLSEPTLPESADHLKTFLALGGASAGTLFTFIALGLLWIRKPYLRKTLMKE